MHVPRQRVVSTDHFPFKTCGKQECAACTKSMATFKVRPFLKREQFAGSSPAPFVGRFGYPDVNVGVLSPAMQSEEAWQYDAPRFWSAQSMRIPQIVDYRAALINARFRANVHSREKLLDVSREVGMAAKPVDIEVALKRLPAFRLSLESYVAPMGPQAALRKIEVTSNPRIPRAVDKAVSDTDLKTGEAMQYLYRHEIDENYLTRLLSVGTLGIGKNRRLVPTRWAITATDDTIGKQSIAKVKEHTNSVDYACYFGGYLGNYFAVLLFPEQWGFELFETYVPRGVSMSARLECTTDWEGYAGRKRYAENCAGGYYAARLPVAEMLNVMKKQGSAVVLRFITDEYTIPLGVWVVREAVRKALETKPVKCASMDLLREYAMRLAAQKFGCDAGQFLDKSVLLREWKWQKKLTSFL